MWKLAQHKPSLTRVNSPNAHARRAPQSTQANFFIKQGQHLITLGARRAECITAAAAARYCGPHYFCELQSLGEAHAWDAAGWLAAGCTCLCVASLGLFAIFQARIFFCSPVARPCTRCAFRIPCVREWARAWVSFRLGKRRPVCSKISN